MTKAKTEWQPRGGTQPPSTSQSSVGDTAAYDPGIPQPAPLPRASPPAVPEAVVPLPSSQGPAVARPSRWGSLSVRGVITEVGEPRTESVNVTGNLAAEQVARGCVSAPFRAIGIVLGILFAPFRMLLGLSLTPARRPDGPDRAEVPGYPFLVQAENGTEYDCYLRGELRGGFLRMGDTVEVAGRLDRHHVLRVSTIVNLRTRSVSRGYVDPKVRYATARGVIAVALLFLLIYVLATVYI